MPTTDIVFGESARKVKSMALLRAFTLVETAVAIFVFSVTASMVATLALGINRFNRNLNDSAKANVYVNNIAEVLNGDQSDATMQLVFAHEFTDGTKGSYYVDSNFSVFNAKATKGSMTYQVTFKMQKETFAVSHTKYVLTINKITRIGEERALISPTTIEVDR